MVKRRRKRRILGRSTQWVHRVAYQNHVWSYDFLFDQTEDGRTQKCITVVDNGSNLGGKVKRLDLGDVGICADYQVRICAFVLSAT